MSKIFPFSAWHYSKEKFPDVSRVLAPPYDVIGPEKQQALYEQSPYNVAWIDLPRERDGMDKYQVAAKLYQEWKKSGVLVQDERPAIYLYFQTYTLPGGEKKTRKGFFARRLLEPFGDGGVKPHEQTFAGPKADRLALMEATRANLSPIFGLFPDPKKQVEPQLMEMSQGEPLWHIPNLNGEEHRLWKIDDPELVQAFLQQIHDRPVLIADGHHRYETAVHYRDLHKAKRGPDYTGQEAFNFVMMYFCSLEDSGLVVLPTHRVLAERPPGDLAIFQDLLKKYGTSREYGIDQLSTVQKVMTEEAKQRHLIAWVHDNKISLWDFDPEKLLASENLNRLHLAMRDLDVTILHQLILEEIMGVSHGAQREYGTIYYIKEAEEAVRLTQEKNTFGFLLNSTKISQIEAVTEIGEVMPQKSTFFYPKLPTGLVFHDLT